MGRKVSGAQKWFHPGLGVKRWLVLVLAGITILGLGFAYQLHELYTSEVISRPVWRVLALACLPEWARTPSVMLLGLGMAAVAIYRCNR